jgi:hypothetical protein
MAAKAAATPVIKGQTLVPRLEATTGSVGLADEVLADELLGDGEVLADEVLAGKALPNGVLADEVVGVGGRPADEVVGDGGLLGDEVVGDGEILADGGVLGDGEVLADAVLGDGRGPGAAGTGSPDPSATALAPDDGGEPGTNDGGGVTALLLPWAVVSNAKVAKAMTNVVRARITKLTTWRCLFLPGMYPCSAR